MSLGLPDARNLTPYLSLVIQHFQLLFENSYARVFRVKVPAQDATLLHQHDLPICVCLSRTSNFSDQVTAQPKVHVIMADGQMSYSKGGFEKWSYLLDGY